MTDTDDTPGQRFLRRLYRAEKDNGAQWAALHSWQPITPNPEVIAVTADAPDQLWPYWAVVGKMAARYGGLRGGKAPLGAAMRRVGRDGAFGPNNPAATRLMRSLVDADTIDDLDRALAGIVGALRRDDIALNWSDLVDTVTAWAQPHSRDRAREYWARTFYTHTPAPAGH
ncbi:type I-E CRISPR-associated protein Cse2/CasB [Dietzia sp. 179-F 9C3 NHS]|uniref:type I-E CRISPR-associated protein Cse2/CasB n=1 Tax=Dietzia sp. 179-F 9C3 NHS TaxID=3374295 RepID=UPI00387948ED